MIPRGYKAPAAKAAPQSATGLKTTGVSPARSPTAAAASASAAAAAARGSPAPPKATQSTIARLSVPKNSRTRQLSPAKSTTPGTSPTALGTAVKRQTPPPQGGLPARRSTDKLSPGPSAAAEPPLPATPALPARPKAKAPNNTQHSILYDRALAFSEACAQGYILSRGRTLETPYAAQYILHHSSMAAGGGGVASQPKVLDSSNTSDPTLEETLARSRRASRAKSDAGCFSNYKPSHAHLLHYIKAQHLLRAIDGWIDREAPSTQQDEGEAGETGSTATTQRRGVVACIGCGFDSLLMSLARERSGGSGGGGGGGGVMGGPASSCPVSEGDASPVPSEAPDCGDAPAAQGEEAEAEGGDETPVTNTPATTGPDLRLDASNEISDEVPTVDTSPREGVEEGDAHVGVGSSPPQSPNPASLGGSSGLPNGHGGSSAEVAGSPPDILFVDIDEASVIEKRESIYHACPPTEGDGYHTFSAEELGGLAEAVSALEESLEGTPCRYLFLLDSVLSAMGTPEGDALLKKIHGLSAKGIPVEVIGWDEAYPQDTYGGIVTAVAEQAARPLLSVNDFPTTGKVEERLRSKLGPSSAASSPYPLLRRVLSDAAEVDRISQIRPIGDWEDLIETLLHGVIFSYRSDVPEGWVDPILEGADQPSIEKATSPSNQMSRLHFLRKLGDFCLGLSHTVVTCYPTSLTKAGQMHAAFVYGEGGLTVVDLSLPKLVSRGYTLPSGSIPEERLYHAAALAGDYMVLHGGCTLTSELCGDQTYLLHINSLVWVDLDEEREEGGSPLGESPSPRHRHVMASLGDRNIVLFGGLSGAEFLGDTWVFSIDSKAWERVDFAEGEAQPPQRHSPTLTKMGNGDVVLHGGQGESSLLSDVWCFNPASRKWRCLESPGWVPSPRMSHAAAPADNALLVVGGSSIHERTGGVGDCDAYLISFQAHSGSISFKPVVTDVPITEKGGGNSMLLTRHLIVPFQPRTFLVMGGGAHCATYGTFLNKPRIAYLDSSSTSGKAFSTTGKQCDPVLRVNYPTMGQWGKIYKKGQPVVMKGDFGQCVAKWNAEYLNEKIGGKEVSVGVCKQPELTFHPRNYEFKVMGVSDLLKGTLQTQTPAEYLYFRSVGKNMRKDPANFWETMPELADDFKAPNFLQRVLEEQGMFSSAFRASSKDVIIWCHYDVTDGMLFQVSGIKHVILFPPEEVHNLYIEGSSSLAGDVTSCDPKEFPLVNKALAKGRHVVLHPGDMLYIPALWFHTTWAQDPSISVNIMWKPLKDKGVYERNDLYGNKDLVDAGEAQKVMSKVHALLDRLPEGYRNFYARKISSDLEKRHFDPPVCPAREEDYSEPIPSPTAKPAGGLSHPIYAGTLSEIVVDRESYSGSDEDTAGSSPGSGPRPPPIPNGEAR